MKGFDEASLVQKPMADGLQALGWESVVADHSERFGPEGTLGRRTNVELVLTRYLGDALMRLNPGLPPSAYQDALRQITAPPMASNLLTINRDTYALIKSGVQVSYRDANGLKQAPRLRLIDFDNVQNNHFLCVREFAVQGDLYRRRADIVGFVNGLPLLFIECKAAHKDLRHAFETNLADYKRCVPQLFHFNALIVLANGFQAKLGSLSSQFGHFREWKRLHEDEPGAVDTETLLKGVCSKLNFLDIVENFILFDESGPDKKLIKIVASNHQFLGVNQALKNVQNRAALDRKLGVFWHTQGAGKSYSIALLTQKIHRKLGGNFTFLICTDRLDLDNQIYGTFAGCGLVNNDNDQVRAGTGAQLRALLSTHKPYVFTLIHRFNQADDSGKEAPYSTRDDIIVITDEAHRTQNGLLSLNMRNALPNAGFMGFTGTPLIGKDDITVQTFGDYVSKYGFQRAVDDGATVPLYFDSRGSLLGVATTDINDKIVETLEQFELDDPNQRERLEKALKREYHLLTAGKRLETIAEDFVKHYSTAWESGKAMFVCIDKLTCVRMHQLVTEQWRNRIKQLQKEMLKAADEQELAQQHRQLNWMHDTLMAVVVSEEQGELERFEKAGLDIEPHRKLIKHGFHTADGKRVDMESAFKHEAHPFRVAFVCAMWLTGFDVPSLSTLYLDKPLHAHTLMQAIARANRVFEGKNNGLIVDYCGILQSLKKALLTFAGNRSGGGGNADDPDANPALPSEQLLAQLAEAIQTAEDYLQKQGFKLTDVLDNPGFEKIKMIGAAKEAINENDETRKRFQIIAREVFKKFKACVNYPAVNAYRAKFGAIRVIYQNLEEDIRQSDISDILHRLQAVVDSSIAPLLLLGAAEPTRIYDISQIDFVRLEREFARSNVKRSTVVSLKDAIQRRLEMMLRENPLRSNFQKHFEELVESYNAEKDAQNIERIFAALLILVKDLDQEQKRAAREGLSEACQALLDMLIKPDLSKADLKRLKTVAIGLYKALQTKLEAMQDFAAKQATRDDIRITIKDYLWSEQSGLPASYAEPEIEIKAEQILQHVLRQAVGSGASSWN